MTRTDIRLALNIMPPRKHKERREMTHEEYGWYLFALEALEERNAARDKLKEAISLLKDCIEPDENHPFKTVIAGARGDKIREFIRRCEQ